MLFFARYPAGDETSRQSISLRVTVSFIFKSATKLQGYVAPPPPVLFKIPYDAFYPFQSNLAPRGHARGPAGIGGFVAVITAIILAAR